MVKQNKKTIIDTWFEKYLLQEKLKYKFEPYGAVSGKNPDFLIRTDNLQVLVECKEIEHVVFDDIKGAQSVDADGHWASLRTRIDTASKQLKPYADKVDHGVIILGKAKGFAQISINDLHYAMFGNPVIRIPIGTRIGVPPGKAKFDLKAMGALRKNKPKTREMYFPHNYVSAVGIVIEFGALERHKQDFYDKVFEGFYDKKNPLESQLHEAFDLMEKEWKKHKVPAEYSDPTKKLYKLLLIINPLSKKPLPKNFFHGNWDEIRLPEVIDATA